MSSHRAAAPLIVVVALLGLAACTATPAPTTADPTTADPTTQPTDAVIPVCDPAVFTDNVGTEVTAEASALDQLPFPLDGVESAGLDLVCTAHLSVAYADADQTVEFDVLVTDGSLDDTTRALDDAAATQDWIRDDAQRIWRDPGDQNHYAEALAIDQGVLVGMTEAG